MKEGVRRVAHRRNPIATTPMHPLQSHLTILTRSLVFLYGKKIKETTEQEMWWKGLYLSTETGQGVKVL